MLEDGLGGGGAEDDGDDAVGASAARAVPGNAVIDLEGWLGLLSRHADSPLASTCVHANGVGYGTRSSFVLHRAPTASGSHCAWTEARPCSSPAHDGTPLLRSMGRW